MTMNLRSLTLNVLMGVWAAWGQTINTNDALLCDYGSFVHRIDSTQMGLLKISCTELPDLSCNRRDKKLRKLLQDMPVTCMGVWKKSCPPNHFVAGIQPEFVPTGVINYQVFCCSYPPLLGCKPLKTKFKSVSRGGKVSYARQNTKRKMQFFTRIITAGRTSFRLQHASVSVCPSVKCSRKKNPCF